MATRAADDAGMVKLRRDQLELLALTLRNREQRMISSAGMSFATENDRVDYLRSVSKSYVLATGLLRAGGDLARRCSEMEEEGTSNKRGGRAAPVAQDINGYVEFAVSCALQGFRNAAVRASYLSKLRKHFGALAAEVESPGFAAGEGGVLRLAEEARACKEAMWKYFNTFRSPFSRLSSEAFRRVIKQEGQTVADVVRRHQNKLGFEGEFESLEEKQQLQVYNSILEEATGESFGFFDKLVLGAGAAVFLATAGIMAFDIITADDHAEAALRQGLDFATIVSGFALQVEVDMVATQVLAEMGAGALLVSLGALVLAFVAGYIFCEVVGRLIDEAISGGGTKAPQVEGLTFHKITAPPDGREIANEIVRGGY